MAEKTEHRKRKSPRNYAKEFERLSLFCEVSIDVLDQTDPPSDFNKGKMSAFHNVLALLGKKES